MEAIEKESKAMVYEREVGREAAAVECSLEHTLPDYMPEIRKILRVDARPIEGGAYVEEGRAECAGIVAFTVVYTDAEGRPSAVSVNGDYSLTVPKAESALLYLDTELESAACRPLGPRRMSLRARLRCRPHLIEEVALPMPEGEGCERLSASLDGRKTLMAASGEMALSDSVAVQGILPDDLHPILCDGSMRMEECRVEEDLCTLRAICMVRILAVTEEGRPMSFTSRIPIERSIDCEGARPGDAPLFSGTVSSLHVRPTSDGEGGTILEIDGTAECRLLLYRKCTLTPTVAIYSPSYRTEVTRSRITSEAFLGAAGGYYTASGSTAASLEERAALVLDTTATATVRKIAGDEEKPIVSGDVHVRMLLAGAVPEEGPTPCFSVEYTHPFRIEAPISLPKGREVRLECTVTPISSRGRLEGGGYADDTELAFSLAAFAPSTLTAVSELREYKDEPYVREEGTVTVVYPKDGDTLFSLAERYHTTPAALAEANRLGEMTNEEAAEPNSLDGIAFLLIE